MFTFLNSLILSALIAGLIPILIHLFNKQKAKKVAFSSLRFLKKLEKKRVKKVKLYQILLLITRTLLIVFLVLAFARPTLSGQFELLGSAAANTSAVIILDDGLSMQKYDEAGNRFQRALIKLKQILRSFNHSDKIQIYRTSNPDNDMTDTLDLQLLENSFLISNVDPILTKATSFFEKNPNISKEIHIISDMDHLSEKIPVYARNNPDVQIYLEQVKQLGMGNASIDSLVFENRIFEINKNAAIKAYIRNHSLDEAAVVNAHLFIENKRMAQNNLTIASSEQKSIELSFQPKSFGWNRGYIEINDDDLLADNRYYFAINIPEKAKVLFVDNNPSKYLLSAIETINVGSNLEITSEKYTSLARQSFINYDVIILSNLPNLDNSVKNRIKSFQNSGGGIIIIPGQETLPAAFNSNLSKLFGNIKIVNLNSTSNRGEYYTLNTIRKNNPIISELFKVENPAISLPKFFKYFKWANTKNYNSIIQYNDGNPYLLFSDREDMNVQILSSYVDDSWTDLQFKGIYLPLLIKMIKQASLNMAKSDNRIYVGEKTVISAENGSSRALYELKSPEAEKIKITPIFSGSEIVFDLDQFNKPGNYEIVKDSKTLSVIPVNVNAKKLSASNINPEDLVTNNNNINLFDEDDNIEDQIKQARFGEELWKYLIVISILILLIESYLVKKTEGKF